MARPSRDVRSRSGSMTALPRGRARGGTAVKVVAIVGRLESSAEASATLVAVDAASAALAVKEEEIVTAVETGTGAVVIARLAAETERVGRAASLATIGRAADRVGIAPIGRSGVIAESAEANGAVSGTPAVHRVGEVGSVIAMRAEFRVPRVSATSGASALTASGTLVVHAATPNDVIPAHRRLDRSDRRRDVQWEERGADSAR